MAETTPVADPATYSPSPDELERAERYTREPFVYEGEDPAVALAPGSPRRVALDQALAEIDAGSRQPSVAWRRQWSLLLGLERLLSEEEPHLADGTVLSAHQVDALSGTLTALLAEAQRNGNGTANGAAPAPAPVLAVDDMADDEDYEPAAPAAVVDDDDEDDDEPEVIEPLDFEVDIDIGDVEEEDEAEEEKRKEEARLRAEAEQAALEQLKEENPEAYVKPERPEEGEEGEGGEAAAGESGGQASGEEE